MKRLAILGASGHGKVVAEIAELSGWDVSFYDDAFPSVSSLEAWGVLGNTEDLIANLSAFTGVFVAIGNNSIRLDKYKIFAVSPIKLVTLVHPSAVVSSYSSVGDGTVIMAGAVVNPFAKLGMGCIVNTSASIDHDCILGDGVHVSPGVYLAGGVLVGDCSWIGIAASVKQCVSIGRNVTVGAGSVVLADLPDGVVAVGVPANVLSSSENSPC